MEHRPRGANELVCEGCGDCSVQSTCIKGYCPSFVTVRGGRLRKPAALRLPETMAAAIAALPDACGAAAGAACNVLIAGVGGTGVVTTGALLAMAAHLEGRAASTLDLTGLSQKNGAVLSHVKIGADPAMLERARIGLAEADVLLGCDLVVAAGAEACAALNPERGAAIVNTHVMPTAAFQHAPDMSIDAHALIAHISTHAAQSAVIDADAVTRCWLGDAAFANVFLLGLACQQGAIPVSAAALERAIEINGAAVEINKRALALGRLAGVRPELLIPPAEPARTQPSLDQVIDRRAAFLTGYKNRRYADSYRAFVQFVRDRERKVAASEGLATVAAQVLFKLMAYKDEYEVARLHLDKSFRAQLVERFEGKFSVSYNLAPPALAWGSLAGPKKREFGAWMTPVFHLLKAMRRLRGTPFDAFGYTRERRMERTLIPKYRALLTGLCQALNANNHAAAVEIAGAAAKIRGYGHIKAAAVQAYEINVLEMSRALSAGTDLPA